ncbi:MAG: S8 family serine peptidase [Clostridia bacterium]|nr:S8 family serine peptidase [Clostridia bacterium]
MKLKIKISTFLFIFLLSVTAFAQEDTYIVRFNDSVQLFSAKDNDGVDFAVATQEELQEYIEAGIVEHYEPNYEVVAIEPMTVETEQVSTDIVDNWNYEMVNAKFADNLGVMGVDVKVAVIDSGLCSDDMIRSQILNGYDYITDKETDKDVCNDNAEGRYHGTTVSSIIARKNTGRGTGIAKRAFIMPLRVLSYNEEKKTNIGSLSDIISAIDYATKAGCDVINLSLALEGEDIQPQNLTTLSGVINNAVDKGIIVIAAAGNNGSSQYAYPASLDGVISVASVDSNSEHSEFSQYNDKVFVSAPGGLMNIDAMYKVENGQEYFYVQPTAGTSVAAPHVSALAAIAKCIKPDIDDEGFRKLLEETSTDVGDTDYDCYYGNGIINCEKAIKELIKGKNIYLSPADILIAKVDDSYFGRTSVATIYNNTTSPVEISVVYAQYNTDNTLISAKVKNTVTVPGEKFMTVPVPCPVGNAKYMVWENLKSMVPLTPSSFK